MWKHFHLMQLKENMRIKNNGNERILVEFDEWLEKVGDGNMRFINEEESLIALPQHLCQKIDENNLSKTIEILPYDSNPKHIVIRN